MYGRITIQLVLLVATGPAIGCVPSRLLRPEQPVAAAVADKSRPVSLDNPAPNAFAAERPAPAPPANSGVIPAAATSPAGVLPAPASAPGPVPSTPPLPGVLPQGAPLPGSPPGPALAQPLPGPPLAAGDPHVRSTPTAGGALLNLAPWESPTERVVELALEIERCKVANRSLQARITELEALGTTREQALAEGLREVETATTEVSRTRAELQALRDEITTLRARIERLEKEEIELLRAVIAVLERLYPSAAAGR